MTHPFLWFYAKANQMVDHDFTDDVCICYALTKRQAFKKISAYYGNATMDDIVRIGFDMRGMSILTDY